LFVNGLRQGLAGGNQGQVQYASDPVFGSDLYDPTKPEGSRWSTLAPATQMRLYHSGALLMESGHVVTTGSEMNNYNDYWPVENRKSGCFPLSDTICTDPFNYVIEKFTPPYLTKPKRPEIILAPSSGTHDSLISFQVTNHTQVKRVTFIRVASTTHSTNTDQRFIELVIVGKSNNKVYVRLPKTATMAPPGRWYLFALDDENTPSVAKTMLLSVGPKTEEQVPSDANNHAHALFDYRIGLTLLLGLFMVW
jgi:hypothetical protein